MWRNQKFSRQAKVKRIQHHQTSLRTNAKGTSLGRKCNRRKRPTKQIKIIKKMVTGAYRLINALNVNGINASAKRYRLAEWIQKQDRVYAVKRPTSDWKWGDGKRFSMQMEVNKNKSNSAFITFRRHFKCFIYLNK